MASYIDIVEPSRCYQTAPYAEGTPRLRPIGDAMVSIAQGTPVSLRVRTLPGAPVSFTSMACGSFSNGLTAISVLADDQGIATAVYVGTPGTLNHVPIVVGSPVASGRVTYHIDVTPALDHATTASN